HRRRPLPTERQEALFVDLCGHAVTWRGSKGDTLRNPITMGACIVAQSVPHHAVHFSVRLVGHDGDGSTYAIARLAFEACSSAAAVVVDELHHTPPSVRMARACSRQASSVSNCLMRR